MDREKINLIIQNIENTLSLLKLELSESTDSNTNSNTNSNIIKLEDLVSNINEFEPDYFEEDD